MARIQYQAKREIETTGYLKTGSDISAAASDDSFNSSTTSLIGLADNDWFTVAGFANAANNGWLQANGASVLHKITQDFTTSLVNESAGPVITITGYKRGLGQMYDLEFLSDKAERSVDVRRTKNQPMGGGAPEVVLYGRDPTMDVSVIANLAGSPLDDSSIKQWREFLASVEGGESFIYDRYGSVATSDDPRSVMLLSEKYTEMRIPGTRFYTLSIEVLLLS